MAIERVEMYASIVTENEKLAAALHERFRSQGIFVVNVLGGAGAGKTSLIVGLAEELAGERLWVIEGDIASDIDTEHLNRLVGISAEERQTKFCQVRILNHAWDDPAALTSLGVMDQDRRDLPPECRHDRKHP